MLATISGMPVHSRPECLNLNVRCSSTWRFRYACWCDFLRAQLWWVHCLVGCGPVGTRFSGCGVVECDLVACGLAVGGLVRVGGASSPLHGPGGRVLNQSMRP